MIIHDVIQLTKAADCELTEEQEQIAEDVNALRALIDRKQLPSELREDPYGNAVRQIAKALNDAREAVFRDHGTLPESMELGMRFRKPFGTRNDEVIFGEDGLTLAARTPQMQLEDARHIAERLRFVLIPLSYMRDEARSMAFDYVGDALDQFEEKLMERFNIYVLCPPAMYDVFAHVKSDASLDLYAADPGLSALGLQIPVLRSMWQEMRALRARIDDAESRLKRVEDNVRALQTQLNNLQQQIAEQRRREERRRKIEAEQFMIDEPMALAIPKSASVHDDVRAVVGPCWGPDFDDIVMEAAKLKKIKGQREQLDETIHSQLYGSSRDWRHRGWRHMRRQPIDHPDDW